MSITAQVCTPRPRGLGERLAVDAMRRWPCLPRRMSPRASVNGQAPRRRPRPARPCGPGTAYGRRSGPCEALRAPLPSTDALGGLFTPYAPSRFPTPRFDGQSAWFVASRALKTASRSCQGCSRPFQANCSPLFPAFFLPLVSAKTRQTPLHFRLQRLHTFLTNSRFHIIYLKLATFPSETYETCRKRRVSAISDKLLRI